MNLQRVAFNKRYLHQFNLPAAFYYPNRSKEDEQLTEFKESISSKRKGQQDSPAAQHYNTLGLQRNATAAQIKEAFLILAKKHQPNRNSTPLERKCFQEIVSAYKVLTNQNELNDEDKRTLEYYSHAKALKEKKETPLLKLEDEMIGLTATTSKLDVTVMEAVLGVKKEVDFKYITKCSECSGRYSTMANYPALEACWKCSGTGQTIKKTSKGLTMVRCQHCASKFRVNSTECHSCDTRGFVFATIKMSIKVPAGSKNGDIIKYKSINDKSFEFEINILEDDYYRRSHNNILTDKYLNYSDLVLGGTFRVRGIYDEFPINVKAGTESHTTIVVKGKGIKSPNGIGDHIVTIKAKVPRHLNAAQKQLIEELAKVEKSTKNV